MEINLDEANTFFKFQPGNNSETVSPLVMIHRQLWKWHIILKYLIPKERKRLRMTCKGFYYLVNQFTQWTMEARYLEEYIRFYEQHIDWDPNVSQIRQDFDMKTRFVYLQNLPNSVRCYWMSNSSICDADLANFPSFIEKLVFMNCVNLTNDCIRYLPTSLKSLDFSFPFTPPSLTRDLLPHLPGGLTSLRLEDVTFLENDFKHLTCLRCLNLSSEHLTENMLVTLPQSLKHLKLHRITNLTSAHLTCLSRLQLTRLDIFDCHQFDDSSLKFLPAVHQLDIWRCKISGIGLASLPLSLQQLHLDGMYLTDEGMKVVNRITLIQDLDLSSNKKMTNEGTKFFPKMLTTLVLPKENRKISSLCLKYLPMQLQKLEVHDFGLEMFAAVTSCLTDLTLNYCKMDGDQLKFLNPNIQKLTCNNCTFGIESLQYLPSSKYSIHFNSPHFVLTILPELCYLTLHSCSQVVDESFKSLPSGLCSLVLHEQDYICGEGFQYLPSSVTELKLLWMKSFTNSKIEYIPRFLQDLTIWNSSESAERVSDDKYLVCLPPNLVSLSINGNEGFSEEAVKEWKKQNKCY